MASPLSLIQQNATKALKSYLRPDGHDTEDLRTVARCFVAAREHFYNRDGEPDWTGRTHAYREWVREVMSDANVPAGDLSSTQAAIRYHVGSALREVLDADQLTDLGLRSDTPRERSVQKRERISETLNLISGGAALTEHDEIMAALSVVEATLRRIEGVRNAEEEAALARVAALAEGLKKANH
ncbi:hypothetical protein SEA_BAILEYBLU_24 [Arthrobacter phage BaileyBlu]|uniref:Uncharacterized protein n=1 Tax=Arthrobacter phage BaileyBlu TaxID=2910754 RepID=A0AA49GYW4_9CAUD|nr:hypothetical protein PQD78_gp24 [Arthrobacter phage BaileyBlu]UJQ87162.1 hypothetical protein SEA_BAILEYBLU_24 [Arthrobacter phage BaileyBlu]